jgi:alpha-glucosidase
MTRAEWWRDAAVHWISAPCYIDSKADDIGDLPGAMARPGYVASLGVAAIQFR